MGYTTNFDGAIDITPALTGEQTEYIIQMNMTRRMKRDPKVLMKAFAGEFGMPFEFKPKDQTGRDLKDLEEMGLKIREGKTKRDAEEIYGKWGEFHVGNDDVGVIDRNTPPQPEVDPNLTWGDRYQKKLENSFNGIGQPDLWCGWTVNEEGDQLEWDGGEKFYHFIEWMKWMIINLFEPWGVELNGEIEWKGEDSGDLGKIVVEENKITVKSERVTYE